jgi:hypothetical protein
MGCILSQDMRQKKFIQRFDEEIVWKAIPLGGRGNERTALRRILGNQFVRISDVRKWRRKISNARFRYQLY